MKVQGVNLDDYRYMSDPSGEYSHAEAVL